MVDHSFFDMVADLPQLAEIIQSVNLTSLRRAVKYFNHVTELMRRAGVEADRSASGVHPTMQSETDVHAYFEAFTFAKEFGRHGSVRMRYGVLLHKESRRASFGLDLYFVKESEDDSEYFDVGTSIMFSKSWHLETSAVTNCERAAPIVAVCMKRAPLGGWLHGADPDRKLSAAEAEQFMQAAVRLFVEK